MIESDSQLVVGLGRWPRPRPRRCRPPEPEPAGSLAESWSWEAGAKAAVERWLDLAGPALARKVLGRELCDSCARQALTLFGLVGGVPPGEIARRALVPYQRELLRLTDQATYSAGLVWPEPDDEAYVCEVGDGLAEVSES